MPTFGSLFAGIGGIDLASSARVGKRGGRLRSTTSQLAFWPDIGPTCHATETFARSASTTSSQSTSSRAASPAGHLGRRERRGSRR